MVIKLIISRINILYICYKTSFFIKYLQILVPASMPVAPAMGINGDAYQNPGQLPSGVPSAGLGGMYGSPVGHNTALGAVSTAVAPGLPGGAGVSFK